MQKFRCCGAANLKTHNESKVRLTFRHGCRSAIPHRGPGIEIRRIVPYNSGIVANLTQALTARISGNWGRGFKGAASRATKNVFPRPDSWNFLMRDSHAIAA